MFPGNDEFQALLARAHNGCADAAQALFEQYQAPILNAIRRKLHPRMRTQFDSLDFLQDAWATFYALPPEGRQFQTAEQLCSFLGSVASNKVVERFRERCNTHYGQRVHSLDGSAALPAAGHPGPDPTPSRVAMAREQLAQLLDNHSEDLQRLILLAGSGRSSREIAEELGLPARTVRRLLEEVRSDALRSDGA